MNLNVNTIKINKYTNMARHLQGVPRNMTFNKQLFLVKQIFCLILFYFEINFNRT